MATADPTVPPPAPLVPAPAPEAPRAVLEDPRQTPKLVRASLLSPGEALLRETRASKWLFLPGPILATLFFALLGYAAAAAYFAWPPFPYLTNWISMLGSPGGLVASKFLALFFLVASSLSLLWLLIRWMEWTRTVYAVTTSRVMIQRGIISREFDEIPISQVRGVEIHQRILQRIFGYGTVRVTSEEQNRIANVAWKGIPAPFEFQRLINGAAGKQGR
ncbi:MAG: PH domain-containing protein [Thermoplasmata archaeon]|nr:PH domain-containing protein [Thermoplasmata archaeon]